MLETESRRRSLLCPRGLLFLDVLLNRRFFAFAFLSFSLPAAAMAASTLSGVVTNGTTQKPSAGDDVVLIKLTQGMQESTRTKTDSHGRYTLEVPDDAMHLVRVTHEKANYFQPVTPGTTSVNVEVYEAADVVEGVKTNVEELHVEADANELHIVEVLQVTNVSSPAKTQFSSKGFDFYLPADAHLLRAGAMRDGLPVPATASPVGDPGHYTFLFPIRPGETQFGIFYSLPYTGKLSVPMRFTSSVETVAVLLPSSMKFSPGSDSAFKQQPGEGSQTWVLQNVPASQTLSFTVSGTGQLPKDGPQQGASEAGNNGQPLPETQNTAPGRGLQNPLDPEGDRDPLSKYKWWILGGIALLLAIAAGVLLRKPSSSAATAGEGAASSSLPPPNQDALLLQAMKEELFALETDRLQNRIPESEYRETKAALELILRRSLARTGKPVQAAEEAQETTLAQ